MAEQNQEMREQQIEALGVLAGYSPNLIKCMHTSVGELKGEKVEDTYEFLRKVLDGVNWELQVLNGCLSLINEKEEVIDREVANGFIGKLNRAFEKKDDAEIAAILEEFMIPFIEKLTAIAESYQS